MRGSHNYNLVIDSSFQPYSFKELIQPFVIYKDAYEQAETAYDELNQKADTFSYLAEVAKNNPDSKAAQIYQGYADELHKQAESLSKSGLTMGNRRALTNLKRRYQGEIGRLVSADTAMQKEQELRRTMNAKDSSMLYATDNLSIDDFLDRKTPNLYSVSGDDLYKRGAQAAQSASSRIYDNTEVSNLTKYYQEITQRMGYSPERLAEFRKRMEAIPEFQEAVDSILQEKGVNKNLTGLNYERARQSVINGILDGAAYKESKHVQQNPGVLTAPQAAADARSRESHELQREQRDWERKVAGYDENGVYHPEQDQTVKKAEAIAKAKVPVDANGNPVSKSGKSTRKPKEARSYDGKGNVSPVVKGKGTTYGKKISLAEALKLDPSIAQHDPGHEEEYDYFQNGNTVTVVPSGSSTSSTAEEETSPDDHNQV